MASVALMRYTSTIASALDVPLEAAMECVGMNCGVHSTAATPDPGRRAPSCGSVQNTFSRGRPMVAGSDGEVVEIGSDQISTRRCIRRRCRTFIPSSHRWGAVS